MIDITNLSCQYTSTLSTRKEAQQLSRTPGGSEAVHSQTLSNTLPTHYMLLHVLRMTTATVQLAATALHNAYEQQSVQYTQYIRLCHCIISNMISMISTCYAVHSVLSVHAKHCTRPEGPRARKATQRQSKKNRERS